MNLKHIDGRKLIARSVEVAFAERKNTTALLHYLREIDRRRLFSDLGFTSLFDFVVKYLKYSEDQAVRRIAAARLLSEIPEIEGKIASGELTLTNVNLASVLFRREKKSGRPYSSAQKRDFLRGIENKSTRDAELAVAKVSPDMSRPDSARPISESQIELRYSVSLKTYEKVELLRGLKAHTYPAITMGELMDQLCDAEIARLDKSAPAAPRVKRTEPVEKTEKPLSRAAIRRKVWARDGGKCTNCNSRHAVEIDHILPKAMGGEDTLQNLRLLCRKCNQRAAIHVYGQKKMDQFLKSPSVRYAAGPSPPVLP